MRWKYNGKDITVDPYGRIGFGSVVELTAAQVEEIAPTQFEIVSDKTPIDIVPAELIAYEPDVTGLTQAESEEAASKARNDNEDALHPDPTGEKNEDRIKRLEEERREEVLGRRESKQRDLTSDQVLELQRQGFTPEQIKAHRETGLSPQEIRAGQGRGLTPAQLIEEQNRKELIRRPLTQGALTPEQIADQRRGLTVPTQEQIAEQRRTEAKAERQDRVNKHQAKSSDQVKGERATAAQHQQELNRGKARQAPKASRR